MTLKTISSSQRTAERDFTHNLGFLTKAFCEIRGVVPLVFLFCEMARFAMFHETAQQQYFTNSERKDVTRGQRTVEETEGHRGRKGPEVGEGRRWS